MMTEPPVLRENPWDLPPPTRYRTRRALDEKQINRLLNLSLACSAVFLCLIFPVLLYQSLSGSPTLFGLRFAAVTEAAMEPAVRRGAVVLAKQSAFDRLEEGDIVLVEKNGRLILRRVVTVQPNNVITKGDAALLPDAEAVTEEMFRCRVVMIFNWCAPITQQLID